MSASSFFLSATKANPALRIVLCSVAISVNCLSHSNHTFFSSGISLFNSFISSNSSGFGFDIPVRVDNLF
jgi:hypothetical protein